jgi:hypothetical protein
MTLNVEWIDTEREPQCAPNPAYPNGIDIDCSRNGEETCFTLLAYPAKRRGFYLVRCDKCKQAIAITTAGRPDDPSSLKVPCKRPWQPPLRPPPADSGTV